MKLRPLLCLPLFALACGSSSADGQDGQGGGDSEGPGDIVVYQSRRFGFSTGEFVDEPKPFGEELLSVTVRMKVDGKTKSFPGVRQDDGTFVISGAPREKGELEMVYESSVDGEKPSAYISPFEVTTGEREVRFGQHTWRRADVEQLNDEGSLELTLDAPETLVEGDIFSLMGVGTLFYRRFSIDQTTQANVPVSGSSSSSDWSIRAVDLQKPYGDDGNGLPTASDDLWLVQQKSKNLSVDTGDGWEPWRQYTGQTSTVASLDLSAMPLDNGGPSALSGTLAKITPEELSLDFKVSSYAFRSAAGYPGGTTSFASVSMEQEAGEGPELYNSVPLPSWYLETQSVRPPVDPECYPLEGECAESCGGVCDAELEDASRDPGDLAMKVDMSRVVASGMRDILYGSLSYSYEADLPGLGLRTLRVSSTTMQKRTNGTVKLDVGAVRALRLGSVAPDFDGTTVVECGAQIEFDEPSLGKPDFYEVIVWEFVPDSREARVLVKVQTRERAFTIDAERVTPGRYYYLTVGAVAQKVDFSQPDVYLTESRQVAGIFSAPFEFDCE